MSDYSRFKVNPDPPEAGETLEITYVGPATEIEYQVDGQDPVTVTPNESAATIDALADSTLFAQWESVCTINDGSNWFVI